MQPLFISTICSSRLLEDLVVDADLAELVLDHGDALAVVFLEDAVEQRGLAAAEEAGEDGDRDHVALLLTSCKTAICECVIRGWSDSVRT